jgi:hypothetical protein
MSTPFTDPALTYARAAATICVFLWDFV